jgi:hypothetical protein
MISQLVTLKNDAIEDQENKGDSIRESLAMKKKFERLDLNINAHHTRVTSVKTLITSYSKEEELQKEVAGSGEI